MANESEAMEVWRKLQALPYAIATNATTIVKFDRDQAAARVIATALEARDARIRELEGALGDVWKKATQMRNASKLVGPYPNDQSKTRLWAQSLYHAGKELMELLKPTRAILTKGNTHD